MQRFENYELERELGRGATAKIYLARDEKTNDLVSLKIFHPKIFSDPAFSQRIQREIKVSAGLKHKNIVPVLQVLNQTDPPALVMSYVDGDNLEKFQNRLPYVLPEVSALIVIEILKALEYAHGQGLIHRDLKPENVLIRKDGEVFVTDFGLAKVQDTTTMITQTNAIVGSLDYMAPEQARGDVMTSSSDLFSVATILYFLTTGTRPFSRASTVATLQAIKDETPESPQKRNPKLSVPFSQIIQKGLEKDPADRFASATEFREALEGYLKSLGLTETTFSLSQWVEDPTGVTVETLRLSVETLNTNCEQALKDRKGDRFLELLAHLSLKAPQSPTLARLTERYKRLKQGRWKIYAAASVILLLFVGLGAMFFWKRIPQTAPMTNSTGSVVAAQVEPVQAAPILPPPAPVVTERPARPAPAPTGMVRFNVSDDIRVIWDGKEIDASKPLLRQRLGEHRLTLTREGHRPIHTKVQVTADEPVVVNVK